MKETKPRAAGGPDILFAYTGIELNNAHLNSQLDEKPALDGCKKIQLIVAVVKKLGGKL